MTAHTTHHSTYGLYDISATVCIQPVDGQLRKFCVALYCNLFDLMHILPLDFFFLRGNPTQSKQNTTKIAPYSFSCLKTHKT